MRFLFFLIALTGCTGPVGSMPNAEPRGGKADESNSGAASCRELLDYSTDTCGDPLWYESCFEDHPDGDMRPEAVACCDAEDHPWCYELAGDLTISARSITTPLALPSWAGAMSVGAELKRKGLTRAVQVRLVELAKKLFGYDCDAVPHGYEARLEETTLDEMLTYLEGATRFDPAAATIVLPQEVAELRQGIEQNDFSVGTFRVFRGDLLGYACGADGIGRFYLAVDSESGNVLWVRVVEIAD